MMKWNFMRRGAGPRAPDSTGIPSWLMLAGVWGLLCATALGANRPTSSSMRSADDPGGVKILAANAAADGETDTAVVANSTVTPTPAPSGPGAGPDSTSPSSASPEAAPEEGLEALCYRMGWVWWRTASGRVFVVDRNYFARDMLPHVVWEEALEMVCCQPVLAWWRRPDGAYRIGDVAAFRAARSRGEVAASGNTAAEAERRAAEMPPASDFRAALAPPEIRPAPVSTGNTSHRAQTEGRALLETFLESACKAHGYAWRRSDDGIVLLWKNARADRVEEGSSATRREIETTPEAPTAGETGHP